MTPDQLKNSILQLAIQGKLVEQRPEEGNAEELFKQIQAEKAELIKQGKIKKDKNESTIIKRGNSYFEKVGTTEKCIDDELPFEIPDSWLWVRLDELAIKEIRRGKSPKYAEKGSAFAFAQKCNSKYEGIKLDLALYLDDSSLKRYSEEETIKDKDIIINSTGTGTLGRIVLYKESFNVLKAKYYPDSHVTVLRVSESVSPEYIYAFLKYNQHWLERQGEGSTKQKELKPHTIKNMSIPLPPLAEQHRIVAKIEKLLPMVEKYGEAYNKLEALNKNFPAEIKKSILQYAIQGKLTEEFRAQSEEHREDPFSQPNGCQLPQQQSFWGASSLAPTRSAPKKLGEVSRSDERGLIDLSAEELLARIQAEKAELIKQGKLKKDKNESTIIKRGNSYFEIIGTTEKCIDDELPFEIPDTWLWVKLDELAIKEIRRGKSPKYAEKGSAFAFAQKCNSKHEGIKLDLALYLDDSSLKRYSEEEAIIDKDIIINSTGTGTLGRIGFYKESYNVLKAKYYPDSHVTVLRVSKNILPEFVFACLKYHNPWLEKQGEGSTNQKELKPHTIKNLPIPLPPLAKQHRIVAKIEELFALANTLTNK